MANSIDLERRAIVAAVGALPALVSATAVASAPLPKASIRAQRLAWAGVKLELDDTAVFVDARAPSLEDGAPGPTLGSASARCFALVTHHHGDHCDPVALKPVLGEHGYLVAHDEVVRWFDNRIVNVQPVRLHEPVFLSRGGGAFVARCVPASDGLGSPQVSWIIDGAGKRVIHCGDTMWHGGWWDISRAYGPFDVAFLPINGFRQSGGRYRDIGQVMAMTPEQAVSAAKVLEARLVVPIHYGARASSDYIEEPGALERFSRAASAADIATKVMCPGDTLSI